MGSSLLQALVNISPDINSRQEICPFWRGTAKYKSSLMRSWLRM